MLGSLLVIMFPFFVVLIALVVFVIWFRRFDYQCENCGTIFRLPLSGILLPHMMGKRLAVCPHCGEQTWAAPVPKER